MKETSPKGEILEKIKKKMKEKKFYQNTHVTYIRFEMI